LTLPRIIHIEEELNPAARLQGCRAEEIGKAINGMKAITVVGFIMGSFLVTSTLGDHEKNKAAAPMITIFLCGDVMTGRGIDQVLPHPNDPVLHEPYMKSAKGYVELAEEANGPIPRPVDHAYIWGDLLRELEQRAPDVRIINLETSVTRSDDYWKGKEVLYRMHPENAHSLTAAKIDICSLANNHVLDWGYPGLQETLETLRKINIRSAGAGWNLIEAERPAVKEVKGKGRIIFLSLGSTTSGIPPSWAAATGKPGVNLLSDFSEKSVQAIRKKVQEVKQGGDIVIASIHWGGNWGYEVAQEQREFAHRLIDHAGIDVIHGHSSHHVKGFEVYRNRLILYGCGDFLTDYEGIAGYEYYRGDLGLMYFVTVEPSSGKLLGLTMVPTQVKRFRINRVSGPDALWLRDILNREGKKFETQVELDEEGALMLVRK
jgi:poly-gamma-glutamate synthesis protein (capsule biosynthesis protein)